MHELLHGFEGGSVRGAGNQPGYRPVGIGPRFDHWGHVEEWSAAELYYTAAAAIA